MLVDVNHSRLVIDGLMAFGYAVIFWAIFSGRMRKVLPALMWCSAVAVIFNLLYEWTSYSPNAVKIALFLRLCPPWEACWILAYHRVELRRSLLFLGGSLLFCCTEPKVASSLGYLSVRDLATVGMTLVCIFTSIAHRIQPFTAQQVLIVIEDSSAAMRSSSIASVFLFSICSFLSTTLLQGSTAERLTNTTD